MSFASVNGHGRAPIILTGFRCEHQKVLLASGFYGGVRWCVASACGSIPPPDDTRAPAYLSGRYVLSKDSGFSLRIAGFKLQNILPPPATSFSEGLREYGNENIAPKTEPPCGGSHEWGRRPEPPIRSGVLRAIAAMLPRGAANPFAIICGTSAGAINATSPCQQCRSFSPPAVALLVKVWGKPACPRHLTEPICSESQAVCVSVPCCAPTQRASTNRGRSPCWIVHH